MPRPTEPARIAGVILAAGASRRMGQNKMLLELEGESLVRRAAKRALGAGLSPVVVVIGHEADRLRAELKDLPLEFAVNPDYTGPTSGSLHQGLNKLRPARDRQAHGLEVKKGERREAVVVMLGDMVRVTVETLALFGELLAWTGEGCGKAVVQAHKHEAMYVDRPEALLADVDTPEDFEALRQSS